jgi:hypothetical protein
MGNNKKYKCKYCGRVMESLSPHNCTTGFRKNGLYFKAIIMDEKKEMVNHPQHYNAGSMECIDGLVGAFGNEEVAIFCKINAMKYIWRLGHKDDEVQEIGKIKWYLDKYLELKNSIEKRLGKDEPTYIIGGMGANEQGSVALYGKEELLQKGLTNREAENILKR